jgi:hypothetical protein
MMKTSVIPVRCKIGSLYLLQLAQQYRQITTTEIYARVSDDSLKRAVAAAKWHPRRVGASSGRHLGRLH